MMLSIQSPKQALKPFLKQKPLRKEIDAFKTNLISLLDKIKVIEDLPTDESEEHLKNDIRDFLRDTYYKDTNAINTKDKKDLVIHLGKTTSTKVGVIIEAKRPSNKGEMITQENANKKALHEVVLYYLHERIANENNELKQLVITNINEWYIIDANWFDKHIYRNTAIKKLYENKVADKKDNPFFYEEVGKVLAKLNAEIPCVYFNIIAYDAILRNNKKEDDRELISLFKILSPQHLLKIASPNDSNSLNEKFYKELLHIIGLEEVKEGGKNIIRRKKENRHEASLLETTIDAIATEDVLHRLPDASLYGATQPERIFNVALELCITWMNRILFLKLLEGQLTTYHAPQPPEGGVRGGYRFLNSETINDYDELFKLFHKVLAVNVNDRAEALAKKYARVPYLNSSLFEISELEDHTIKINVLDNSGELELFGTTVLKDVKKKAKKLPTLQYLFAFLDAYDFASEGKEDIQEESKDLINASVLGKIFEKINGYKDGSIFTPGFITMYMCRQSIRQAVVQKFNEAIAPVGEPMFDSYEDIRNYCNRFYKNEDILRLNKIVNSLRICDPAVGSGHFLVSALNELIKTKADFGILSDEKGNYIRDCEIEIENDELIINDSRGRDLSYEIKDAKPISTQIQTLQKTLFHEKQQLIENCLFGVDINPNSVKICRLRLWIELLKNAYYKEETGYSQLETLPNIDINIKCGNSLLSRFALDADLTQSLKSIKYTVKEYREFVTKYKNERNRDAKRELQKIINGIKTDIVTQIRLSDPKKKKLDKLLYDLYYRFSGNMMFEDDAHYGKGKKKDATEEKKKLESEVKTLETELEEVKTNAIYKGAFEWRFEFPEVLDDEGKFLGFDVVVGNPPYGVNLNHKDGSVYQSNYSTFNLRGESYTLFIERAVSILKAKGQFSFIVPDTLLSLGFTESIRKYILKNTLIDEVVLLPTNFFAEATVDTILLFFKKWGSNESFNESKVLVKTYDKKAILENLKLPKTEHWISTSDWHKNNSFNLLGSQQDLGLISRIDNSFSILSTCAEMFSGIKSYEVGKGNPAQTTEIRDSKPFTSDKKKDNDWSPFFDGKHIGYYSLLWNNDNWIKYGEWLAAPRLPKNFTGEKILIRKIIGKKLIAHYIPHTSYCNTLLFVLKLKKENCFISYKTLLGVINSSFIGWYFLKKFQISNEDTFPQIMIRDILQFPIPNVKNDITFNIETLVDKILTAKEQNQDTTDLERQIDVLVYQLYGLTEEEIKIVEGA